MKERFDKHQALFRNLMQQFPFTQQQEETPDGLEQLARKCRGFKSAFDHYNGWSAEVIMGNLVEDALYPTTIAAWHMETADQGKAPTFT